MVCCTLQNSRIFLLESQKWLKIGRSFTKRNSSDCKIDISQCELWNHWQFAGLPVGCMGWLCCRVTYGWLEDVVEVCHVWQAILMSGLVCPMLTRGSKALQLHLSVVGLGMVWILVVRLIILSFIVWIRFQADTCSFLHKLAAAIAFDSTEVSVIAWSGTAAASSGASGKNLWVMGGHSSLQPALNDTYNIFNF